MNCDNRKDKIHAYLKGRLTPAEAADFKRHLDTCGDCRREFAREKNLDSLLAAWDAPEPRPGFSARLRARVSELSSRRSSWADFRMPVFSALSALLILSGLAVWHEWPRLSADPRQMSRAEIMLAGEYEFLGNLDMLQHWEMLRYWEEIAALGSEKGKAQ